MIKNRPEAATLRQVAAEAGVSVATVSRVISGADPVSAELQLRVRSAMKTLSFEPNRLAQGLRAKQTNNIGLVLPGFTNTFFFELIAQTIALAKESGYSVLVTGDPDPEREALRLAGGKIIDGLLYVAARHEAASPRLAELDIPIVCFDRAPLDLNRPIIQADHQHGAEVVTEHLIEQGARRIAHIAGEAATDAATQRLAGYEAGLRRHGLAVDPSLVVSGDFSEASGARAMAELLSLPTPPDAVFAANDLMAIGAMRQASVQGLTIPNDLLFAGFDGITPARYTVPGLTTYAQPIAHMARLSVSRLLDLIRADDEPAHREVVTVSGHLVVRESSLGHNRKDSP